MVTCYILTNQNNDLHLHEKTFGHGYLTGYGGGRDEKYSSDMYLFRCQFRFKSNSWI